MGAARVSSVTKSCTRVPYLVAISKDRVEKFHHVGEQRRALLLAAGLNTVGKELKLRALHALGAVAILLIVPLIDAARARNERVAVSFMHKGAAQLRVHSQRLELRIRFSVGHHRDAVGGTHGSRPINRTVDEEGWCSNNHGSHHGSRF